MRSLVISSVLVFSLFLSTSGCAILESYSLKTQPSRMAIARGDYPAALAVFPGKSARGRNEVLIRLERGMILQDSGQFEQSSKEFEQAGTKMGEYEDKAVISVGKAAAQAGTFLVNEQMRPYEGEDFEKILLHALNAVNYVMRGDLDGARVEIRNAYQRQEELSEKHARELDEARREAGAGDWEGAFQQADRQVYELLRNKAASVYSVYHNAFASCVSALVYELSGEPGEAYIDLKKAIIASPGSRSIQGDLIRLGRSLNYREEVQEWEGRFGAAGHAPKDAIDVFVIFSQGLSPHKEAITLPIPISHGLTFASLPVYRFTPAQASSGLIVSGSTSIRTSAVFDTDATAAKNLLDDFPIIFAKQIARSYIKARATSRLGHEHGDIGAILGTLFSGVTEQADLRTWSSLPKEIQVGRAFLPRSADEISIRAAPSGFSATVPIPAGTSHLVVLVRTTETGLTIHTRPY